MKNQITRVVVVAATTTGLAIASAVAATSHAHAATSWERTTTGATGWGSLSRSSMTYKLTYTVYDIKKDDACAYVRFRPQVKYEGPASVWLSVGWSGYEKRVEVCGWGKSKKGTVSINVWDKMSSVDRALGVAIRMQISVCRNRNNAVDNCSTFVSAKHDI